jgi:hypothetical protein
MGFNITHIIPEINNQRNPRKNSFKSSTNDRSKLFSNRQDYSEIISFDWDSALGLGTELGFNNLRALDFDGSSNPNFISWILGYLGLPKNYEWVVQSGSNNGFHVLFYSDYYSFPVSQNKIRAFNPNAKYSDYIKRIELRWTKHLVLPPSLHKTGNYYKFAFCEFPLLKPSNVLIKRVEDCIKEVCFENGGYNKNSNPDVSTIEYEYDNEHLDFSPILIDKY